MIWDADFMLGPPRSDGTDSYVLGEVNVSSVFPLPEEASGEIAGRVAQRLQSKLILRPLGSQIFNGTAPSMLRSGPMLTICSVRRRKVAVERYLHSPHNFA